MALYNAKIVKNSRTFLITPSPTEKNIKEYIDPKDHYKPDYELAVEYANIVADEIIDKTTPEIVFTDK